MSYIVLKVSNWFDNWFISNYKQKQVWSYATWITTSAKAKSKMKQLQNRPNRPSRRSSRLEATSDKDSHKSNSAYKHSKNKKMTTNSLKHQPLWTKFSNRPPTVQKTSLSLLKFQKNYSRLSRGSRVWRQRPADMRSTDRGHSEKGLW